MSSARTVNFTATWLQDPHRSFGSLLGEGIQFSAHQILRCEQSFLAYLIHFPGTLSTLDPLGGIQTRDTPILRLATGSTPNPVILCSQWQSLTLFYE